MNARTLGKILGALGLVTLLSAPYTDFVTTGSPWMALTKAVLGVLLVAAYFATNLGEFGPFAPVAFHPPAFEIGGHGRVVQLEQVSSLLEIAARDDDRPTDFGAFCGANGHLTVSSRAAPVPASALPNTGEGLPSSSLTT